MDAQTQACASPGSPSLLAAALLRAAQVGRPEHTCVVIAAGRERLCEGDLQDVPPGNIVVQPEHRGSGISMLLPLLYVLRRDPAARVLMLPADHHVADEPQLGAALRRAVQIVNLQPHKIVLLGVAPDAADQQQGFIVPGAVNGPGTRAVSRFAERPPPAQAAELVAAGALRNAFIVAAEAATLATLFRTHIPAAFDRLHANGAAQAPLAEVYDALPCVDFLHGILAGSESILCVLTTDHCGWRDLDAQRTPLRPTYCLAPNVAATFADTASSSSRPPSSGRSVCSSLI